MRMIAKTIVVLSILGGMALGAGPASAQYAPYYPYPPPPPPRYYYRPALPPGAYYPPSRRWRTFNGCPPHYTIQDGICKPYRGF